jgi:hypothetical protein
VDVAVLAVEEDTNIICGVKGGCGSVLGFEIMGSAKPRVLMLSRRRFGASFILGWV